jgi:L-asparagine transporter-like permease
MIIIAMIVFGLIIIVLAATDEKNHIDNTPFDNV